MGGRGVRVVLWGGAKKRGAGKLLDFHICHSSNRFCQHSCPKLSPVYGKMATKGNCRWILPKEQIFLEA